jgi:hypothetical protein
VSLDLVTAHADQVPLTQLRPAADVLGVMRGRAGNRSGGQPKPPTRRLGRNGVVSGALTLVALAGALGSVTGCGSVDPTDPSYFTNVLVRNDTASAVQFIQCDTSCGTLHDRETIPVQGSAIINISNEGINIGYLVEQPDGKKLGCVYMKYEHVKHLPTVLVSSMTKCK